MVCSPYFAVTGTHPLLTFDICEANYLLPPPNLILLTTDLISQHAVVLQKQKEHLTKLHSKVFQACRKATIWFEHEHSATIKDFDFKLSDLMLIRNTAIEKALN